MGNFAKDTMQKGGEFYTPASIVRLIVEVLEPYHGRILDPACGSAGMFVHSAEFVKRHQKAPEKELSIYGVERTRETWRLAQMNLAVHGLSGKILDADTYRDPVFEDVMKEARALISSWPIRPSMLRNWTRRNCSASRRAIPRAFRPPTTPITSGSAFSFPASTRRAAPVS